MTAYLKDYTDQELRKFMKPAEVEREFGLDRDMLENFRSITKDTGTLRGPVFLKDENVILYQRKSVVIWIKAKMFSSAELAETSETSKNKKVSKSKVKSVK